MFHLHHLVFCTEMSVPQKGGNLEETDTLFLILKPRTTGDVRSLVLFSEDRIGAV